MGDYASCKRLCDGGGVQGRENKQDGDSGKKVGRECGEKHKGGREVITPRDIGAASPLSNAAVFVSPSSRIRT